MTDTQLEFSVREVFQVFGNCYVKIRRDHKGMPYAFCQYEVSPVAKNNLTFLICPKTSEDAQRAINLGRGMKVNGRDCRTEVARVNREHLIRRVLAVHVDTPYQGSLYLSKTAGGSISEEEARQVLAAYGDLERLWHCSQTDKEMFRLAEGIWVMFAYFQDCRDAQTVSAIKGLRDLRAKFSRLSVIILSFVLNSQRCQTTYVPHSLAVVSLRPLIPVHDLLCSHRLLTNPRNTEVALP